MTVSQTRTSPSQLAVAKARPDADLWIDANQSYRPVHLESFLQRIAGMEQVRCLEQPVVGRRPLPLHEVFVTVHEHQPVGQRRDGRHPRPQWR